MKKILIICLMLFITGCETDLQIETKKRQKQAWDACLEKGGVPLQSWFSDTVLADCKFNN